MAVKKTQKARKEIKNIESKESSYYKKIAERLQLKLEKSEEKIIELNEKYKKAIDTRKKKLEDKYKKIEERYKKIIKKLENNLKKSTPKNLKSAENDKSELLKLQRKLEQIGRAHV